MGTKNKIKINKKKKRIKKEDKRTEGNIEYCRPIQTYSHASCISRLWQSCNRDNLDEETESGYNTVRS